MKPLIISFLTCFIGLAFATPVFSQHPAGERPNIVVILADDMGYSDIGCYGGEANTPNLDRLAAEGLRFRTFYNAARCCPTRASLLTGVYPHEAGMGEMVSSINSKPTPGPYQGYLSRQAVTLAEVLKQAGYSTYMSGKWHVGERPEHWPRQRGFDRYFGLISGASSYFELVKESMVRQMVHDDDPWFPPAEGFYMTDAFTDTAVTFLETHQQEHPDDPFFLYLAYTAPHWPLHALKEDILRYEGRYDAGWDTVRAQRYERMKQLGIIDDRYVLSPRTAGIPDWDTLADPDDWADRMEVYTAMIDRMDQGIGKVVETLRRQGKLDNTLILFLSDNGGCAENIDRRKLNQPGTKVGQRGSYLAYDEPWANVSNTPYRKYKAWTNEGGILTPLIVHWPGHVQQPGTLTDAEGHIVDIMATCVTVAGAEYPHAYLGTAVKPMRGRSLLPILSESTMDDRILCWEHFGRWAIKEGSWKLVGGDSRHDGQGGLYNLEDDPTELNDLSDRYPERAAEMKRKYVDWAEEVGVRTIKGTHPR